MIDFIKQYIYKIMSFLKELFKGKPKPVNVKRKSISDKIQAIIRGKEKVEIYELVRKTACGRHAWYNSNVGLIRKPIQG